MGFSPMKGVNVGGLEALGMRVLALLVGVLVTCAVGE